ncbi:hypothetical protein [Planomonospora venezuelensis]|uniref:Uncharacterized protein n=1 Tax=Planomonospora venezuelensis TaxID=1999 RepID=A0A841CUH2_PLAVE|nr:hypothetical protein [Planomonospora venezuelensis]MBB5961481.1 hypothetical protein [Planomonospora venezuelensis]GIM98624.1 hypothetical protein Pve01_02830 [Planomonospora venezuelensis]
MEAKTPRRGPRSFRLRHALAVPSAIAVAVALPGAVAHPSARQPWTVTGTVNMRISDYETFGSNEICNHLIPITNSGTTGTTSNYWYFGKCGGEIRAEIHYNISRNHFGTGRVNVRGTAYLYEGDSENTTDLDGTRGFQLAVESGKTGSEVISVQNTDEDQPADYARITLTLNNP